MALKLTRRIAETAAAPTDGNPYAITYDTAVRGLGIRVTKAQHRAWILNYRTATGVERRQTIGDLDDWPLDLVRNEARRLRRLVDQGQDPLAERRNRRSAPTIADLVEQWRVDAAPKKRERTRQEYEGLLRQLILPAFGNRKVAEITRDDIVRFHAKASRGAPVRANRALAFISTLFNIAIRSSMRPDNPASKIERNHEVARQRYLQGNEIARLSAALAAHRSRKAADAIRLLLLTGARRAEVLSMSWGQLDLDSGTWTKPASATKQKREHAVPLSPPVRLLLGRIRTDQDPPSGYVFPSHGGHLVDIKTSWHAICRSAGLAGVRLHDLRHSFASVAASSGASLQLIGALLGHSQPSTTARYAHLFDDAQRAVADRVGAIVSATD